MCSKLLFSIQLTLLLSFSVLGQVDLIFPKNEYVFDSVNIEFDWNDYENATSYDLQVSTDQSFSSLIVDETLIPVSEFNTSNLTENETYYWRSRANNSSWSSIYSFRIVDFSAFSQLELWLKADSVQTVSGNRVSVWYDLSANLNHYNQPNMVNQPYFQSNNNGINDFPMIEFVPSEPSFFDANDFSSLSEGEVFSLIELKNAPATSGNTSGLWSFGTSTSQDHYPYNNNVVYCGFGRNTRFTIGDVSGNVDLTEPHLLNVNSGASFNFRINDIDLFASTSGAPSFNSNIHIGRSLGNHYMDGSIGELILFNEVLPDSLRSLTHQYLRHKYAPPVNLGPNYTQYGFCDTTLYAGERFESYLWSNGSTADSLVVNKSGTYWVEVTDIFGFTSSDTIQVILPEPNTPNNQFFCPSDSTTWHTNLGPNYNYLWSDGSTADSLSIDTPGDYHVQITDTNGCVFQSDTLTFGPDPFESIVTLGPDQNLCTGNTLTLADGDSLAVDYLWSTGSTDSSITMITTDTYFVDVVNTNGCEASDTIDVTIIGDAPLIDIGIPNSICRNASFSFQDLSSTTDGSTIISWDWNFGDGSSSNNESGTHTYTSPGGNYPVSLTIETSAGCFKDTTDTISVLDTPELSFTSNNACQGNNIQFNGGQLTPTTITTWEWDFDDPSSGANNTASGPNVSHIFNSADNYDINLVGTDINGCIDTVTQSKTILPSPQVDFTFDEICEGNNVNFQNTTTIDSPGTVAGYNWSFGDGTNSGQENPQKPYNAHGDYSVNLIVTSDNGCSGQRTRNLKVHAIPFVDQNITENCAGLPTQFNDASYVPNGSVAEVLWSIDNGVELTGLTTTTNFNVSGSYSVTQTTSSAFGCTNSATFGITINDFLSAGFDIAPSVLIADYPIQLVDTSQGADSLNWFIDQTAYSNNADTTFVIDTASIGDSLTILQYVNNSFGCIDSVQRTFNIVGQRTDLAVEQLFLEELNGYLTIGVQLHNRGTTPIHSAELELKTANGSLKEIWEGELREDESIIYVFDASPSSTVSAEDLDKNRICVEAQIQSPQLFNDEDLSNNEQCLSREETFILLQPQPNPVDQLFSVKLIADEAITGSVLIINAEGQIVRTLANEKLFKQGLNKLDVDASSLASGTYTIIFVNDQHTKATRFIKL